VSEARALLENPNVRLENAIVTADPLHNKDASEPLVEKPNQVAVRYFISSLSDTSPKLLGQLVRGQWSVENLNHHKRDDSVWQEDRHRFRRINVAQNLALTRNALLAIIPFDENRNLPSLIAA
jgi:predicted transposase YbfD/YdcC